jgi:hypothetical protein
MVAKTKDAIAMTKTLRARLINILFLLSKLRGIACCIQYMGRMAKNALQEYGRNVATS